MELFERRLVYAIEFLILVGEPIMNGLIYLVGLIVVIMFVLSFLGLH